MKNIIKTSTGIGFCFFASLLCSPNKVFANECATNPDLSTFRNGGSCYITPDVYKITVYEMGLCTSDPLATTTVDGNGDVNTDYAIDESTCSATFINESGVSIDLAGGASQALTG